MDNIISNQNIRPFSDEDYLDAKKLGLDLNDWNDYKKYFNLEEYVYDDIEFPFY